MNALKPLFIRIFLVLFGVMLPCLLLEAALRIEHRIRKGTPLTLNPSARWDDTLGWTGKEHVFDPISENPVLVIGDSFTDGLDVPSDQMWFAEIARRYADRGLIAYGGLGYGTLQQLMVLQRYHARGIKPALVILQLCSNDILNNSFELEKESLLQRAPGPRPYLEGDTIRVRFPRSNDWLLHPLVSISRFAYRTSTRWEASMAEQARAGKAPSVEFEIQKRGFSFEPFRRGARVTRTLLKRFKQENGTTPLVFMLVDDIEPYSTVLKDAAQKLEIPLIIPPRVVPLGPTERLPDGTHLNAKGNQLLGRTFLELASEKGSLP
jgi:lysophospholipase L1-like esterase